MVTIYALTCIVNGKAYVGCTAGNPSKRYREHRCNLEKTVHSEPELQSDWNLHGRNNFEMRTVYQLQEDAPLVAKRAMEELAMRRFKERGLLYNRNEACFQPTREAQAIGIPAATAVIGKKRSAEANEKRRMAQLGIPKNHGHKISATKQAKKLMR